MIAARAWVATRPQLAVPALALAAVAAIAFAAIGLGAARATPAPAAPGIVERVERRATTDGGRIDVRAILGTPAYLRYAGQSQLMAQYAAERDVMLIYTEEVHWGRQPAKPRPTLLVDGRAFAPSRATTLADSGHHRTMLFTYSDAPRSLAAGVTVAEVPLDAAAVLRWERPYGGAAADAPALSIPLFLALLGGMLASMWPCLFQLTAYFLPSVAGLSMEQARAGRADRAVLRTAVLFVSGIVIVYTLAGFAAGVAAQSVAGTALFESARQPLTLVAGLVIVGMAARLALRARRPLVCHMPASAPTKRGGIGTVLLGLAFATGCMTCFGAAVVLGMFTYVVTTASPLVGAAVLFVFSLGIAVPLVIAAVAMARVLPLIARLERAAPALMLVSAAIMAGYGVLLIAGTSHRISDVIARLGG